MKFRKISQIYEPLTSFRMSWVHVFPVFQNREINSGNYSVLCSLNCRLDHPRIKLHDMAIEKFLICSLPLTCGKNRLQHYIPKGPFCRFEDLATFQRRKGNGLVWYFRHSQPRGRGGVRGGALCCGGGSSLWIAFVYYSILSSSFWCTWFLIL